MLFDHVEMDGEMLQSQPHVQDAEQQVTKQVIEEDLYQQHKKQFDQGYQRTVFCNEYLQSLEQDQLAYAAQQPQQQPQSVEQFQQEDNQRYCQATTQTSPIQHWDMPAPTGYYNTHYADNLDSPSKQTIEDADMLYLVTATRTENEHMPQGFSPACSINLSPIMSSGFDESLPSFYYDSSAGWPLHLQACSSVGGSSDLTSPAPGVQFELAFSSPSQLRYYSGLGEEILGQSSHSQFGQVGQFGQSVEFGQFDQTRQPLQPRPFVQPRHSLQSRQFVGQYSLPTQQFGNRYGGHGGGVPPQFNMFSDGGGLMPADHSHNPGFNMGSDNMSSLGIGCANMYPINGGSANMGSFNAGSSNTSSFSTDSFNTDSSITGSFNTRSLDMGSVNMNHLNLGSANMAPINMSSVDMNTAASILDHAVYRKRFQEFHLFEDTSAGATYNSLQLPIRSSVEMNHPPEMVNQMLLEGHEQLLAQHNAYVDNFEDGDDQDPAAEYPLDVPTLSTAQLQNLSRMDNQQVQNWQQMVTQEVGQSSNQENANAFNTKDANVEQEHSISHKFSLQDQLPSFHQENSINPKFQSGAQQQKFQQPVRFPLQNPGCFQGAQNPGGAQWLRTRPLEFISRNRKRPASPCELRAKRIKSMSSRRDLEQKEEEVDNDGDLSLF